MDNSNINFLQANSINEGPNIDLILMEKVLNLKMLIEY